MHPEHSIRDLGFDTSMKKEHAMKRHTTWGILIAVFLSIPSLAVATEGVSPGAVDRMVAVHNGCPTFSWEAVDGAELYEIVAYSLHGDGDPSEVHLSAEDEVLYAWVPGGALAWTPSAEQALAPGGRYVWFVRAATEMIEDQILETTEWSTARYFRVPAAPSADDVARAVEVIRRWEAANGHPSSSASAQSGQAPEAIDRGAGTTPHRGQTGKALSSASAAIRGENPETDVEAYGVVGSSASVWGAGVGAMNTEGGPDLVLDGSMDGMPDTRLSEWGIDRSDAADQVFTVANLGGGAMTLEVLGTFRGTELDCPDCIDTADLAEESVDTWAIADDGVTADDIAPDAVGKRHIADGQVQAAHLAVNAVTGASIADGSVTAAAIADGAVTATKIRDGAVGTAKLQDEAVTPEKILANSLGPDQIAFESIGTTELADGSVTDAKIAAGAIQEIHLSGAAIPGGNLTDGSVTGDKLAEGSVTGAKIAIDAVGASHLQRDAVTMSHIADDAVGSAQIELAGVQREDIDAGAIDSARLADDAVTSAKIADGAVTSNDLAIAAVTSSKIQDQAVAMSKLAPNSVTETKLFDGAVTSAKIENGAVTSAKIANQAITAAKVAPGEVQLRIGAQCPEGSSIRSIDQTGAVVCEAAGGADLTPPVILSGSSDNGTILSAVNTGTNYAIVGANAGDNPAVFGHSTGAVGIGVKGTGDGIEGIGVVGEASDGIGVQGNGYEIGGRFEASHPSGSGLIATGGATGFAAKFDGNVQIRDRDTHEVALELGKGLDYAEGFDVSDAEALEPGTVLVIDPQTPGELTRSRHSYDTRVAGIIAGANGLGSGVRLGAGAFDHDVALAGRVYCKVDATRAGIEPGDLLTTSDLPGFAMKATDADRAPGATLGKAMEPLAEGTTGQILVLVTLQ
jgi:hypothetical protein